LFNVQIGPERIILTDGLQPFAFRTSKGTLVAQAQLSFPPGYKPPAKNAYPGLPGTVVSRDGGQTWRRWSYAARAGANEGIGPIFEGAATELRDGTILILDWIVDGPSADGRIWTGQLWESRDDFRTVTGPTPFAVELPQAKVGFDDGGHPYAGITFHRTALELPGGDLFATIYCWFKGDDAPCPYRPVMCKFRTVLLRSADRGRSWRYVSTVAVDPAVGEEGFNEPVMVRLGRGPHAGRLVCLMRTGCDDCPVYQAHSGDEGATWSRPRAMELGGVDPDLIELSDGALACVVGRRIWRKDPQKRGYYLAFSRDAGDTWSQVVQMPRTEPHALAIEPLGDQDLIAVGDRISTHYSTLLEIQPGVLLLIYDVGAWGHNIRYIATRRIALT